RLYRSSATERLCASTPREPHPHHTRSFGEYVCRARHFVAYARASTRTTSTSSASAMLTSVAWSPQPAPNSGRAEGRAWVGMRVRVICSQLALPERSHLAVERSGYATHGVETALPPLIPVSPRSSDGNIDVTGFVAVEPGCAGLTQTMCVPGIRERPNIA